MSAAEPATRLLIVDDHFVVRFGLRRLLELQPGLEVVAEAKGGVEAVKLYRQHRPDVVLMDLRMDGFDGLSATQAICKEEPSARVLVVSSFDTELDVQRARQAGAVGFVVKEGGPAQLLEAIAAVVAGRSYLPANLAARLEESAARPALSPREMQLLQLMVDGLSNRKIAERTKLTHGTVKVYVCHLLAKLNVANRSAAIFEAVKRGMVKVRR
jgi:two-component system NarL family response regulator